MRGGGRGFTSWGSVGEDLGEWMAVADYFWKGSLKVDVGCDPSVSNPR